MNLARNGQAAMLLLTRVLTGAIFVWSGVGKLTGQAATIAYIEAAGVTAPATAYWLAVVTELAVGAAFIVGVRVRESAVVLALFTLAAAVLFHGDLTDRGQLVHLMKNLAIAGGLLHFALVPAAPARDGVTPSSG